MRSHDPHHSRWQRLLHLIALTLSLSMVLSSFGLAPAAFAQMMPTGSTSSTSSTGPSPTGSTGPTASPTPSGPTVSAGSSSPTPPGSTGSSTPAPTGATGPTSILGPTTSLIVRLAPGLTEAQQADVIASHGGVETSSIPALRMHVVDVPASDVSTRIDDFAADASVQSVDRDRTR